MLKILAIVPCPHIGGLQVMTLHFFEQLCGKTRNHFLLSRWTDGEFSRRLEQLAIPYSYSWMGMFSRKLDRRNLEMTIACVAKLPRLYWDFLSLVRYYRPDVIYTAGYHELILLWPVLLPLRIPVIYHAHGSHPTHSLHRATFLFWGKLLDHYISVSQSVKASILNLGVAPQRISLLYNGVNLSRFAYNRPRSEYFSARYGWLDDTVIVGMTGLMTEGKGHLDFIEAAHLVHKKYPEVRFVIGGRQEQVFLARMEKYLAENILSDIVVFSGWQDDMQSFYAGIDIFVLPSRWIEGLPLVIAEAMATGLPVVATRTGGSDEIVEDEKTGILVEKQNPGQLSEAICSLVTESSKRIDMGRVGRRRVETHFDLSKQTERLVEILETVENLKCSRSYFFM